ncbi:MAG: hypothetical protein WCY64_08545, partial [Candidatus Cloacimonadaceae bacterium]
DCLFECAYQKSCLQNYDVTIAIAHILSRSIWLKLGVFSQPLKPGDTRKARGYQRSFDDQVTT